MEPIPGILLSAGSSVRFGSEKLLTLLPTGETLFERALKVHLQSQISPLIVVVSAFLGKVILEKTGMLSLSRIAIEKEVDPWYSFSSRWGGGKLVINKMFKEGMSSSIHKGLGCLRDEERDNGVLISLADLPYLSCEAINFLIKKFLDKRTGVLVPVFNGTTGHPVIVDINRFRNDIVKIKGDVGLKVLINKYPKMVERVPWKDDSVTWDIDNPRDLERLL